MKLVKWLVTILYLVFMFIVVLVAQWGITKVVVMPVNNDGHNIESVEFIKGDENNLTYGDLISYTTTTIGNNLSTKSEDIHKVVDIKGFFKWLNTPAHYVVNWPVHIFNSIMTPVFAPMRELDNIKVYRQLNEEEWVLIKEDILNIENDDQVNEIFNSIDFLKRDKELSAQETSIKRIILEKIAGKTVTYESKELDKHLSYLNRYNTDKYDNIEENFFTEEREIRTSAPYAFIHLIVAFILAIYWTKQNPVNIKRGEDGVNQVDAPDVIPRRRRRKKDKK